jgi:hypothetical protein
LCFSASIAKTGVLPAVLWKHSDLASKGTRMRTFNLFYILALLLSCDNPKESLHRGSFQSFDFTYNDVFSTCFSIKFLQSDTAFIKQHFATSSSDNLKSNNLYYAFLSKEDRMTLDSFISNIPFSRYEATYYEDYQDGVDFQFFIQKDTIKKLIRVHSDSVPSTLNDFMNWIVKKKKELRLHQIDTSIHFESEKYIVAPPATRPTINYTVPKL